MMQIRFGGQVCQKVLARLDSYIDNELLVESNLDLMEHLERCTGCTREADARRSVRTRLRTAVRDVEVPSDLEGRVRGRLREARRPQTRKFNLMAIAAALAVCLGSWYASQFGALRRTTASSESYLTQISSQVATIMRVGLGDHIHCAVIGQRLNHSKVAVDKLPAEFKGLIPIVQQHVPAELPLLLAHECQYQGRKFIHLTFRNDRSLLSLIIARRQDGESLGAGNLLPALSRSGIPIYTSGVQQFQVAAFERGGLLVYTVSDLPRQKNLDVLASLAPALQTLLSQMGA